MKRRLWFTHFVVLALLGSLAASARIGAQEPVPLSSSPQAGDALAGTAGTLFTFQGQLARSGVPVNASCTMQFKVFDAASAGAQQGPTQSMTVAVQDGSFTVALDFGGVFTGDERWLEPAVQCPGDAGLSLLPRQRLNASPYALSLVPGAVISGTLANTPILKAVSKGNADGIEVIASATGRSAIYAHNDTGGYAVSGFNNGADKPAMQGTTYSAGVGVRGESVGAGTGVWGTSNGGKGVHGAGGAGYGVYGESTSGTAVYGTSSGIGVQGSSTGAGSGVQGAANTGNGVLGTASTGNGVLGRSAGAAAGVAAVKGDNTGGGPGVLGTSASGTGVLGTAILGSATGVRGESPGSGAGVSGQSGTGSGVQGTSAGAVGAGVLGQNSSTGYGVKGASSAGIGLFGWSATGNGLVVESSSSEAASVFTSLGAGSAISATATSGDGLYGSSGSGSGIGGRSQLGDGVYGQSDSNNGGHFFSKSPTSAALFAQNNNGPVATFVSGKVTVAQIKSSGDMSVHGGLAVGGDIIQPMNANGVAKAGFHGFCGKGVNNWQGFNNVATTTYFEGENESRCVIDFGFDLSERYIMAQTNGRFCNGRVDVQRDVSFSTRIHVWQGGAAAACSREDPNFRNLQEISILVF